MALALVVGLVPIMAIPALAAGPTVSGFTASPLTAGSAAQYGVTVSVLAGNTAADSVSITFPSGFTVPSTISRSYISFGGQPLGADPIVNGQVVTMLLPDSDGTGGWTTWAAGNYPIIISQLAGIKNPSVGVYRYRLTVAMSQYTDTANSNYIVIIRTVSRSPSSGVRGTTTTVTGAGFASGTTANVVLGRAGGNDVADATGYTLTETASGTNFVGVVAAGNIVRNISDGSFMVVATVAATTLTGVGITGTATATGTSLVDTSKNFANLGVTIGTRLYDTTTAASTTITSVTTTTNPNDTLVGTLSAGSWTAGDAYSVGALRGGNGGQWTVGDLYAVELTGPSLGSGTVGTDGTFIAAVTCTVPPFVAGSNTLVATDGTGRSATASFTINPSASLSPASGRTGATIAVAARDYIGATIASTTVAGVNVAMTPAVPTVTGGAANFTFAVPAGLAGAKTVVITDSAANTVSTTLTVLGSPLTASPATGVIGTRVTVSGTGFTANGNIPIGQLMFGATAWNTAAVTIDSGGNFLVALTLSSAALDAVAATAGTYTITALDSGGLSGAVNFTVPVASITLDKASSVVGSSLVVRGVGFPASTVAIVTYGGNPVGTGMVDSTGNFSAAISVPTTAVIPSTNTVAAYAITANAITVPPVGTPAQATHSVPSAALTLSVSSANPGSIVVLTGTGFPAYAVATALSIGGIPAMPSPAPATDGNGNITANVLVPSLPAGPAVVALTIGGVTGSVALTVGTAAITPGVALAGIQGLYVRVWGFNASTQAWQLYDPAAPAVSDLTALTKGQGYWIKMTQATTLVYGANSYALAVGWNLIGWLG